MLRRAWQPRTRDVLSRRRVQFWFANGTESRIGLWSCPMALRGTDRPLIAYLKLLSRSPGPNGMVPASLVCGIGRPAQGNPNEGGIPSKGPMRDLHAGIDGPRSRSGLQLTGRTV